MNKKKVILILFSFLFVVGFVDANDCGGLTQCQCGDYLVESQTMWYDLIDCPGNGLYIAAEDIVLDCDGHTIDGGGGGYGIHSITKQNVVFKNCIVKEFLSIDERSRLYRCRAFNSTQL